MKHIERFTVVAAIALLVSAVALGHTRPSPTSTPTTRLRPEQVATLPARIQAQVGKTSSTATTATTASRPMPEPSSSGRLRPEQILTLPPQIQGQVGDTAALPAPAPRPEYIRTLPLDIQDQVPGTPQGPTG